MSNDEIREKILKTGDEELIKLMKQVILLDANELEEAINTHLELPK
ncbi:hypothetical protein [Paenibacillus sp. P3E]|nr:hypothetical protein [Paenibacillus sp. P3E]